MLTNLQFDSSEIEVEQDYISFGAGDEDLDVDTNYWETQEYWQINAIFIEISCLSTNDKNRFFDWLLEMPQKYRGL